MIRVDEVCYLHLRYLRIVFRRTQIELIDAKPWPARALPRCAVAE